MRLFDCFRGPHWTLLAFGAAHAATTVQVARRYPGAVRAHLVVRSGAPARPADLVDSGGCVQITAGLELTTTSPNGRSAEEPGEGRRAGSRRRLLGRRSGGALAPLAQAFPG